MGMLAAILLAGLSYKPQPSAAEEPAKFASYQELTRYIDENTRMLQRFSTLIGRAAPPDMLVTGAEVLQMKSAVTQDAANQAEKPAAPDFSGTNNQVRGVDEADLVKTDGDYIYVISGNKVAIIQARPAGKARKLSEIKLEGQPVEAFINGNTLVVFGNGPEPGTMFVNKYDVTDRSKPELVQNNKCDGYHVNSRMTGDQVYVVINTPVYRWDAGGNRTGAVLPRITTNGQVRTVPPTEIHYFPYPDYSYQYTTVLTMDLGKSSAPVRNKTFLTGTSQNLYVSQNNIYLAGGKAPDFALYTGKLLDGLIATVPPEIAAKIKAVRNSGQDYDKQLQQVESIIDEYLDQLDYDKALALEEKIAAYRDKWYRDLARDQNKTVIYKLGINNGQVTYRARGEVDGRVLNQFSMDEHNGYFRIATTSEGFWFAGQPDPKNNIFVLDENMNVTGKITGLAPTERIYSARFMGDRAYLVTFRQVDPLFVIDLKNPTAPKVLGELKIPGYSDYLHPYDENHLIGIGREVTVVTEPQPQPLRPTIMPPPTRQRGVKIALFDVSNPNAPREIAKYVVERDDSDSPALRDHRAVLFSKERNLLVIPINYYTYRIMNDQPVAQPATKILPAEQGWQGVYVFEISPQKGIRLRGKVEHPAGTITRGGMEYYRFNTVKRSLYIDDVLYTVSDMVVKLNDLDTLRQLKQISIQ